MRIKKFVGMRSCALFVALITGTVLFSGCNSAGGPGAGNPPPALTATPIDLTTTIFSDSFENTDDCLDQIKDWSTLVLKDSCLKTLLPTQHLKFGTFNFGDDAVGPAADGHRALYFFASPWGGLTDIHLVSKPFSLTGLTSIKVSFSYLVFGLNGKSPSSCSASQTETGEFLRLEACNGAAQDCITSAAAWTRLFQHDPALDGNSLDGRNQVASDWKTASVTLQVSTLDASQPIFFDFHARMDRGLEPGAGFSTSEGCCKLPTQNISFAEAAAIDQVVITGTKPDNGGGGEGPGGGNPDDGGGGEGPGSNGPPPS